MPTLERLLTSIKIRLDSPSWPTERELLDFCFEQNQMFVNRMRLSDEGWLLRKWPFVADGASEFYPIPAPGFAGAFLVHTDQSFYTDNRRREVSVKRMQDLELGDPPWKLVTTSTSEPDQVQTMAFYCEDGQWRARVLPYNAQGNYIIWYEPSYVGEMALANTPQMLEAFHPLLIIAVAQDAVGLAKWDSLTDEQNAAKRNELRPRLLQLEGQYRRDFEDYLNSMNQAQTTFRQPFETSRGAARRFGLTIRSRW